MNTRNELGRYLKLTVPALAEFCDEIRINDDGSTDGTFEWLLEQPKVSVQRNPGPTWRENEGELHQTLLDWTIAAEPTHVLAIDADEIVVGGERLREVAEENPAQRTFTLRMVEIWRRDTHPWQMRVDGRWGPRPVGIFYGMPRQLPRRYFQGKGEWRIWGRKMAGGRVPRVIRTDQIHGDPMESGVDILHLGWSDPAERAGRYQRYVELDGGNFHAKKHLDSIMLPDAEIELQPYEVIQ